MLLADDTTAAVSAESAEELKSRIEMTVTDFGEWCWINELIANMDKTVIIVFSKRKEIRINVGSLRQDSVTKFLGLRVDNGVTWEHQIDTVCGKLNSGYYLLLNIKKNFSRNSLIQVYYALVYSHLNFNIIHWGYSVDHMCVFILQKKIIRLIFNLQPKESCRPAFRANKILTLASIYLMRLIIYTKENPRENLEHLMTFSNYHSYETRGRDDLVIPKHRTASYERSASYMGIKVFRHLPSGLGTLNFTAFKQSIKRILADKCYYSRDKYFSDTLVI